MIELVTKGGKKIGELSDVVGKQDSLIIDGKSIPLEDVYNSEELLKMFNSKTKELTDEIDNSTNIKAS